MSVEFCFGEDSADVESFLLDNGSVDVQGFTQHGKLEQKKEGGSIRLIENADSASVDRPKVWICTDMSDPTLKGKNKEGTINDPDDVSA